MDHEQESRALLGFFVVGAGARLATTVPEMRKICSHRRHERAFIGTGFEALIW
jgi:hypothetical protein